MLTLGQLIDFYVLGRHRLETVETLPLGSSIDEAVRLYGAAIESGPSQDAPEITEYTFSVGRHHEAVISEWQEKVQSITFWSVKSDPGRDLRYMLDQYGEDSGWNVMEEGYWYQRKDGRIRLWCSVAPAIGVAYVEFLTAKAELKTANSLKRLSELSDIEWAPNDVISELQRQFVENQSTGLTDFASRSNRIAVSPDGRHVFVVRDHRAYDVPNGFMELNAPPELGRDYSTQVINCFTFGEHGTNWGKISLPRDANVDCIRFEGDQCQLQVRQTSTQRVLTFRQPAESIRALSVISIMVRPLNDQELWRRLEEEAEPSTGANGLPSVAQP
ncbi:hypothetical protein ACXR0O_20490 [Verrucomicrobiota bacterium sgz303538]